MKGHNLIALSISLALLSACNDSSSNGSQSHTDVQYGTFTDSPVAGLTFETPTQSGVTDSKGTFRYLHGENVRFSLGSIVFPEVPGRRNLTPMSLYDTDDATETAVVNTLRLLQSLDSDEDPENGITILPDVSNALSSVNLDLESDHFEADANSVFAQLNLTLISEEAALSHFVQGQPYQPADLIGAWFEVTATLPVRTSQSPIDIMDHDFIRYNIDRNGYTVEVDHETEAILDDAPFWLNVNDTGQLLSKDTESEQYRTNTARLSNGKDKIAFVQSDDGDVAESEFGLMIKLAEQYHQQDLTGNWFSVGMELPKKGQSGQIDLPMVYLDKLEIDSEGEALLSEMFVEQPSSDPLKLVLKDNGNISVLDEQVPIGSEQDTNRDGWLDNDAPYWFYLSRSKDVMLLADDDHTLWGFVTIIKQAMQPKLSDVSGTWTLYSVELPPVGNLDAAGFAYHVDTLVIDAEGNIRGEHLTDSGAPGDGTWTAQLALTHDGLFVTSDKLNQDRYADNFNVWVINESRDLMMNVYSVTDTEQGYAIAVRSVTAP